jgi:hypothetical protein
VIREATATGFSGTALKRARMAVTEPVKTGKMGRSATMTTNKVF